MRLLLVVLLALVVAPAPAAAQSWQQCVAQPTKECVFDRARDNARANVDQLARAKALAQLARGEIDAGLRDRALRDVAELYDLSLKIGHAENRQEHLVAVVEVRAKARDFAGAAAVLPNMTRDYWIAMAVRLIATEMTMAGRLADAVALFQSNAATSDNVNAVRHFAWDARKAVVQHGEEDKLVPLLQHAQDLEDANNDPYHRVFTGIHHPSEFVEPMTIMVGALADAGKTEAALNLARQMKKPPSLADALAAVGKVGDPYSAAAWTTYGDGVNAEDFAEAAQVGDALAFIEAMPRKTNNITATINGRTVDFDTKWTFYRIAKALAKVGRTRDAIIVARESEFSGGRIRHGIGVVAEGLAEVGRIDEALEAAKLQTNSYWRDSLLLELIRGRVATGHVDHARGLLLGIARDIERAAALLAIAAGHFASGSKAEGVAAVSDALQLTPAMAYPNQVLDILIEPAAPCRNNARSAL